jgi:hypothetical protein
MEWHQKWSTATIEVDNDFHALLTFDKNLRHQQNFQKYGITVFVLSAVNNTYLELSKLSPKVHQYLSKEYLPVGPIIINVEETIV